jgi:uracil-DNA glycosylase family 4
VPPLVAASLAAASVLEASVRFEALVDRVQACRLCPTMEGRRRVLSGANGPLGARVLFVAEAPGRLGGDRTGIPLDADQAGRNFAELLAVAGLRRDEIFITNAVLCNPRTPAGNNRPPGRAELVNCQPHLADVLAVVPARLVVALGAVALAALGGIADHGLRLREDVGQPTTWHGRVLVPLYHPGPRARIHRPANQQRQDFRRLRGTIDALGV